MERFVSLLKREIVLTVSLILAAFSVILVKPDEGYANYIDYQTLALLFSLMVIMAQFQKLGLFEKIAVKLLQRARRSRRLISLLVLLCFFSSMLITNDVALITFVPFTIAVLRMAGQEKRIIPTVALQTAAANLGSMATPVGNPQNLYLYARSGMSPVDFTGVMLPYVILSAALFFLIPYLMKDREVNLLLEEKKQEQGRPPYRILFLYFALFLESVLAVAHVLPWQAALISVAGITLILDPELFRRVDYSLLLTFAGLFIFIGNVGRIPAFSGLLRTVIQGNELLASVAVSQVISNVPAALLLSGFTAKWNLLIVGTNLGGLGSLIASMASLISYKHIAKAYPQKKGQYLKYFTISNIGFLAVLLGAAGMMMYLF